MKRFIQFLILLLALAEGVAWTYCIIALVHWSHSLVGAGDGGPASIPPRGSGASGALLISAIWFLPLTPHFCMVAGSLKLLTRKLLFGAYFYVIFVLFLITLAELLTFKPVFLWMAAGNAIAGALWAYRFRDVCL